MKIDLEPKVIKKPRITHTISCPASATFEDPHDAIQIAFEWTGMHLHQFWIHEKVPRSRYPKSTMILCDKNSSILEEDHAKDTSAYRLHQIFDNDKIGPREVIYEYDLGDPWRHYITCTKREEPTKHFVCLRGQGRPCAEDVGGCCGWLEMLEAFDAESPTEEQIERMDWYGLDDLLGNGRWQWDKDAVNQGLAGVMDI